MAKIKVHELRSKSKTELLNQVCDFSRISGRFYLGLILHRCGWACLVSSYLSIVFDHVH